MVTQHTVAICAINGSISIIDIEDPSNYKTLIHYKKEDASFACIVFTYYKNNCQLLLGTFDGTIYIYEYAQ